MAPEREYVECECSSTEHFLRLTWWKEEDPRHAEVYVDVFLNEYYGFWKRLWMGIKYAFGYKSKYGHYDEAIWGHAQVRQVRAMCNRWLAAHPEAEDPESLETRIKIAGDIVSRREEELSRARENLESLAYERNQRELEDARKAALDRESGD